MAQRRELRTVIDGRQFRLRVQLSCPERVEMLGKYSAARLPQFLLHGGADALGLLSIGRGIFAQRFGRLGQQPVSPTCRPTP